MLSHVKSPFVDVLYVLCVPRLLEGFFVSTPVASVPSCPRYSRSFQHFGIICLFPAERGEWLVGCLNPARGVLAER